MKCRGTSAVDTWECTNLPTIPPFVANAATECHSVGPCKAGPFATDGHLQVKNVCHILKDTINEGCCVQKNAGIFSHSTPRLEISWGSSEDPYD